MDTNRTWLSLIRAYERGQVLLIVILVMVVAMTVGLAAATRSITNVRVTREEESSQKAFSAAEAGVEKVLKNNQQILSPETLSNNAVISKAEIKNAATPEVLLNNGSAVLKDDGSDLWLSNYPGYTDQWVGDLTFYWGNSTDICDATDALTTQAALEIVILKGTKDNPIVDHYAFDPCLDRRNGNNLIPPISAAGETVAGKQFAFKTTIISITDPNRGLIARIVPLYHNTSVGVRGSVSLPIQGLLIESTGESGEAVHKLSVFRGFPKVPTEIFTHVLFQP